MKTKGLLPPEFYLDKYFFQLRDEIVRQLRYNDYGEEAEKMTLGDFKDLITDVLQLLRPTYRQAIKKSRSNCKKNYDFQD